MSLRGSGAARRKGDAPPKGGSLVLLVEDRTGWRNLCRLLTLGHAGLPKPHCRVTWEQLREHREGLIAIARRPELAPALVDSFGPRAFGAISRHGDPDQERANRTLLATGLAPVASGDVRHAYASGKPLLDALTCLRHHTRLDAAGRPLLSNAERHPVPPHELARRFANLPDAIANTRRIAERCSFALEDLGYRCPAFPLAPDTRPPGSPPLQKFRPYPCPRHPWHGGLLAHGLPFVGDGRQELRAFAAAG